jgi:hypothetical protein
MKSSKDAPSRRRKREARAPAITEMLGAELLRRRILEALALPCEPAPRLPS